MQELLSHPRHHGCPCMTVFVDARVNQQLFFWSVTACTAAL